MSHRPPFSSSSSGLSYLGEQVHVLGHVLAQDAVLVVLCGVALARGAGEALRVVRDVEPSVRGALERAEHAVARGGGADAHVQDGAERALLVVQLRHVEGAARLLVHSGRDLAIGLSDHTAAAHPPP